MRVKEQPDRGGSAHDVIRRLHQARDDERRQIARDLHDSTAQGLAAVVMNLELLHDALPRKSARVQQLLDGTLALAQQCVREVRNFSHLLHPPLLDQLGLGAALRSYVSQFSQRSGIFVEMQIPDPFPRLPEVQELTLFRVAQEAFGNIHRHAGSQTALVWLQGTADAVILTVADAGGGIAPERLDALRTGRVMDGIGIAGMRERVELLQGRLDIESSACGTLVRATLPLAATGGRERHSVLGIV